MATTTKLSKNEMIARLLLAGYTVDGLSLPAEPENKSKQEAISQSDSDEVKIAKLRQLGYTVNLPAPAWLPASLHNKDARTWKAMASRRVAWRDVAGEDSPEEVLSAMCSLLVVDRMLSSTDKARLNPDAEL